MQLFDTETPRCCNNVVSCKFKELKKISATNWDKLDKENVSNLWNRTVLAAATKCLMSKRQSLTMIMMVLFFNPTIAKYGGEVHVISTSWTLTWYMPLYIILSLYGFQKYLQSWRGSRWTNFFVWYQKQQISGHACIEEHK